MKTLTIGILTLCSACATPLPLGLDDINGVFAYNAFDENANLVLEGTLNFETVVTLGNGDREFEGDWVIQRRNGQNALMGPQTGSGRFFASISEGRLFVSLNPGTSDNNVHLNGSLGAGQISGNWGYSTFVGEVASGRFTLTP